MNEPATCRSWIHERTSMLQSHWII